MREARVAEIADFGKFGLLRALGASPLRLGVVWYLNPDPQSEGVHRRYAPGTELGAPEDRLCDKDLYRSLEAILSSENRGVALVRERLILPPQTLFHEEPLSFRALPRATDRPSLKCHRDAWNARALAAVQDADLVFLDPDGGLAPCIDDVSPLEANRWVWPSELLSYLRRGQSLIVHHHLHPRFGGANTQMDRWLSRLRTSGLSAWAFLFMRRRVSAYFLIATPRHRTLLLERSRDFANSSWSIRHFHLYAP